MTAANEVTHKVYTTGEVRWILSIGSLVCKIFLVHLMCIHHTVVAGATELDEWIDALGQGSRSKVVVRFYL